MTKIPGTKEKLCFNQNYMSGKAVKPYSSTHSVSLLSGRHFHLPCVFIFLHSLGTTLNAFSSFTLGSASSSGSTTLSPLSPHTTTSMPLQGSIRTTMTRDRIHFHQTVCGCRKTNHRAVGCYTAPWGSQSPHHECSSALRQQLTCWAEEHSCDRHWALLMHNIHLQLPKPHLNKRWYYTFSSYSNCSWCTITGGIIQYCHNTWTKFEWTHK